MGKNHRTKLQKAKRITRRKWRRLLEDAKAKELKNIDLFRAGNTERDCGYCKLYHCPICPAQSQCRVLAERLDELIGRYE